MITTLEISSDPRQEVEDEDADVQMLVVVRVELLNTCMFVGSPQR